jgi:hypothetical protein
MVIILKVAPIILFGDSFHIVKENIILKMLKFSEFQLAGPIM